MTITLPPAFEAVTFGGALRAAAGRWTDKVAIRMGARTLRYSELVARAHALRNAALALGLGPGDRAAIVARNTPEYFEVAAGLPDAGVALATINARLAPAEHGAALEDCSARLVIADAATAPALAGVLPTGAQLVVLGPDYEAFLAQAPVADALPAIAEWDVWTIPYTSGTTGRPKGVLLPHRSRMLLALICAAEFSCFGPDDSFLAITPLNHGGGLGLAAAALATGGTVELMDRFEPLAVLQRLHGGGISGLFMVPTHFQMIFALPEAERARFARPPLRAIISNAAPLPQALKTEIVPFFGEGVLHELYSSTETGLVCNLRPEFQLTRERCVGTPLPFTRVEIRRSDGSLCDVDEVGEIWARSPLLFNGYWQRPDETAAAIRDGWVSVGDLARRDSDGFIYIVDRAKDMIISGGVNIYPREVEEVLLHHPQVADVAVVGVDDVRWGEALHAFIVPRDADGPNAEGIAAFCAGRLASFKVPRQLTLVDELPRNSNGKVLKTELRARAAAGA
jgi:acyl-CoA synthetase (AMP-forming)/AMP-acid ligase II